VRRFLVRAVRRPSDEGGYTLIELLIAVVLLAMITGALGTSFVTAINASQTNTQRVRESADAQLVAAFLVRDAQAAGGSDPVTGTTDPTLGVSLTDAASCTGTGDLVARFKWVDRSSSGARARVVTYYYDAAATQLVRHSCTDGVEQPIVTLGNHIGASPAPSATCHPAAACPGLPETIDVTISERNEPQNAPTPYTYTLSAQVRPDDVTTGPNDTTASTIPLLLLAGGSSGCPAGGNGSNSALAVSGQGGGSSEIRIFGTAMITGYSPNCDSVNFQGSVDYLASGGTSVLAPGSCEGTACSQFSVPIADPFTSLTPPSATCTGGPNPAPVGGVYPAGTYPRALTISGTATFASGNFVFCNGLNVSGTVTSANGGVLLYFAGGSLSVTGTMNVTARTSGAYAGIAVWQAAGNDTTLEICCNNNVAAHFDGVVYVPSALVLLHNGNISMRALIAFAVRWEAGGNGGTTIGDAPPPPVISSPSTLASGTKNVPYASVTFGATGGAGMNTWSATGLPNGLSLDATSGVLAGTPTQSGTFTVHVTVEDVFGDTAQRTYTLVVNPPLTISAPVTSTLPSWTVGRPYSTTISATGGTGTYQWSQTGLPTGLSIDADSGVISGTPTATTTTVVTVTVTDGSSNTARNYSLTINPAPSITTTALPNASQSVSYSTTLAGSGGTGSDAWSAPGRPGWLNLNSSTGVLSGTPSATGTFTFAVTLTDDAGATATTAFTLAVFPKLTISTPATLPAWSRGIAYPSTTVSATGGTGSYTWSATGLPAGMTISPSTGAISGTPSATCNCTVVVTVRDGASPPATATKSYALTINAPPAITTTATSFKKNKNLDVTLAATGGTPQLTWSMSGAPAWVTLNSATGRLTGDAPNAAATYTFTVTVTDAVGATHSVTYTITVTN
jgi:type II secretory pathway pseudopilin PulG